MNASHISLISARPHRSLGARLPFAAAALGILLGAAAPAGVAFAGGGASGPSELADRPEPVAAFLSLKRGVAEPDQPVAIRLHVGEGADADHTDWIDLVSIPSGGSQAHMPMEQLSLNYTKISYLDVEASAELADALIIQIGDEEAGTTFAMKSRGRDGIARFEPIGGVTWSDSPWVESCSSCTAICQTITFFGPDYNWPVDLGPQPSASACIDAGIEACGVPMSFFFEGTCKP